MPAKSSPRPRHQAKPKPVPKSRSAPKSAAPRKARAAIPAKRKSPAVRLTGAPPPYPLTPDTPDYDFITGSTGTLRVSRIPLASFDIDPFPSPKLGDSAPTRPNLLQRILIRIQHWVQRRKILAQSGLNHDQRLAQLASNRRLEIQRLAGRLP